MINAELVFANPDITLTPRSFSVDDGLSRLFDVYVTASSASPDVDLEALVGRGASFRLALREPERTYAVWAGICSEIEQVSVEENGESLYLVRIRPMLWRATQRRNFRIFQHVDAVASVCTVLDDWGIEPDVNIEGAALVAHEYRVQFGENDHAFVSRMLEEAGITYRFEQRDPRGEDEKLASMALVLSDVPCEAGPKLKAAIPFRGQLDDARGAEPHIRNVRLGRSLRPGRFTIAGYDYRSSPDLRLLAEARARADDERRYEQFHYQPGAFLQEAGRQTRGAGSVVASESQGNVQARIGLERERSKQRVLAFDSNDLRLAPGTLFAMGGHPRTELSSKTTLMITERRIAGEVDGDWAVSAEATFAEDPYRPALITPKPRVMGIQSAVVVGPRGEEIFTDELGRVKVHFHWDRYGKRDADSSCWIRVSQGWAGSGYGMSAIPRVGHEVLIDFLEGDPDRPVIVGRAHNRGAVPPDRLPREKTKTTWKSQSTPGGEGFNEISMDDARGREMLFVRAQKDLERQVLANEKATIGANLTTVVRGVEARTVARDQTIKVQGNRNVDVDGQFTTRSDSGVQTQSGALTGVSCVDGKLIITNGSASIVLDGPNVHIDAGANLRVSAGRQLGLYGQQVAIDGTPEVFINSATAVPPNVQQLPIATRSGAREGRTDRGRRDLVVRGGDGLPRRPGGVDEADFQRRRDYQDARNGRRLPPRTRVPVPVDRQLSRWGRVKSKFGVVKSQVIDPDTYVAVEDRFKRRLTAEETRLTRLGTDLNRIFEGQRHKIADLGPRLDSRLTRENEALGKLRSEVGAVFSGERGGLIDSSKALYGAFKAEAGRIGQLRKDLSAMLDRETGYLAQFKNEWTGYYREVVGTINHFKELVNNPKDAVMDIVFGEDRQLAKDIQGLAGEFGYGDQVGDFFGLNDDAGGRGGGRAPGREPGRLPEGRDTTAPRPTQDGRPVDDGGGRPEHLTKDGKRGNLGDSASRTPDGGNRDLATPAGEGGANKPGSAMRPGSKAPAGPSAGRGVGASALRPGKAQALSAASSGGGGGGGLGGLSGAAAAGGALAMSGVGVGLAEQGGAGQGLAKAGIGAADARALSGESLQGSADQAHSAVENEVAISTTSGDGTRGEELKTAGSAVTKDGGLAASDVSGAMQGEWPVFLQSESEGTLMVWPDTNPQMIDTPALELAMVEGQMQGMPVADSIADELTTKGYAVYQRPWGEWYEEFVLWEGVNA